MRKPELVKLLARRSRLSQAEAADRLDGILREILSDLKSGRQPALPGLGKFKRHLDGRVEFTAEALKR